MFTKPYINQIGIFIPSEESLRYGHHCELYKIDSIHTYIEQFTIKGSGSHATWSLDTSNSQIDGSYNIKPGIGTWTPLEGNLLELLK